VAVLPICLPVCRLVPLGLFAVTTAVVAAGAPVLAQGPGPQVDPLTETVHWDGVREDGGLFGGSVELPRVEDTDDMLRIAPVTRLPVSPLSGLGPFGPDPTNRVDMVFVGDGYTASQMSKYASDVNRIRNGVFAHEPFKTYRNYFSIYRVDVVSNESGVDHDPAQGVMRDTALGMGFWCSGLERLLCIDQTKAYAFANNAPHRDVIFAIANASKYGGAGYSNLSTVSSNNTWTNEVATHEFGHSFANLADEYFTPGTTWSGGEPSDWNVSTLQSAQMAAQSAKWWHWLGLPSRAGGTIGTYRGGKYAANGIWRPTNTSLMKDLGRPFNEPSIERLVFEIYRRVSPIDDHSPDDVVYTGSETLSVTPMVPVGHALSIQWFLDGEPISGATGRDLDLGALTLTACNLSVSVTVKDDTPFMRSPMYSGIMQRSVHFELDTGGGPLGTNVCTAAPNGAGGGAAILYTGSTGLAANDLGLRAGPVTAGAVGVFFAGTESDEVPFGDGFLCTTGIHRVGAARVAASGYASLGVDVGRFPRGRVPAPFETRSFQYWYREPGAPRFNLSDALRLSFCP
jgi:hypothetical protein